MVKALHRAGIEVILDVVFNHTAEGDHDGPTLCFRGIDNPTYYILEDGPVALRQLHRLRQHAQRQPPDRPPDDRRQPALLGRARCTWTASASTSPRSWRATRPGQPLPNPPVLWDIESDPALAGTKLIAEAWDAAGLYQVGSFVGDAGRSGTAASATTSATSSAASAGSVRRVADRLRRQPRDLRPRGARGRAERQLRHLPRRLHAQRPGLLQPQAQRGQRRGQPRRRQRQPQLELRRRGADRRPGGRDAAQPAGEELPDRHAAVARACR